MKNTKLLFGFAAAAIHCMSVACEDGNINTSLMVCPVEITEFDEVPEHHFSGEELYNLLKIECYRNNNPQACQQLLAFAEKKIIMTQAILNTQLQQKQQTIEIYEAAEKRRAERRSKRKEAEEKELSNKLNKEN